MTPGDKPLVRWGGDLTTPPMGTAARVEAGTALRRLQRGERLGMPISRPMFKPIGPGCHELRIADDGQEWRIVYCVDTDAIVVLDVFRKTTQTTSGKNLRRCRARLASYQNAQQG